MVRPPGRKGYYGSWRPAARLTYGFGQIWTFEGLHLIDRHVTHAIGSLRFGQKTKQVSRSGSSPTYSGLIVLLVPTPRGMGWS